MMGSRSWATHRSTHKSTHYEISPANLTHKVIQMYGIPIKYQCNGCSKVSVDVTFSPYYNHMFNLCDGCMERHGLDIPIQHVDAYPDLVIIHYHADCSGNGLCLKLTKI